MSELQNFEQIDEPLFSALLAAFLRDLCDEGFAVKSLFAHRDAWKPDARRPIISASSY
jgi:hypothetical protein